MTYPISQNDDEVAEKLGIPKHVPRDWRLRGSINQKYWLTLSQNGFATLDELARFASTSLTAKEVQS